MKVKPTAERNATESDQIGQAYDRLVSSLYEHEDAGRARSFADRLEQLLTQNGTEVGSIFAEECRSLIHEARGDLKKAIKHRENEIRLIRQLHKLAQETGNEDFIFQQYSYADLKDGLEILAMLYHDVGDLGEAVKLLHESKQLCEDHGIKFDSETLLQDYERESLTT
ncbi:MAG TPA: hypothetical protein VKI65_03460 [Gemmataceae bacterium]|nr:hypothetical protein [Gemmataceae bacterium]